MFEDKSDDRGTDRHRKLGDPNERNAFRIRNLIKRVLYF
jgi:hypothetical protein